MQWQISRKARDETVGREGSSMSYLCVHLSCINSTTQMSLVLETYSISNNEEEQTFRYMDSFYIHNKYVLEFRPCAELPRGPSLIQLNLSLSLGKTDKR
jgi:hypothetical protein